MYALNFYSPMVADQLRTGRTPPGRRPPASRAIRPNAQRQDHFARAHRNDTPEAKRQRGQRLLSVGQRLVFEERELDCELHVNDIVSSFMGRGRLLAEGRHDDRQFPRLRERLRVRATDYGSWAARREPLAERKPEQFGDDQADANPVTAQAVKLRRSKMRRHG